MKPRILEGEGKHKTLWWDYTMYSMVHHTLVITWGLMGGNLKIHMWIWYIYIYIFSIYVITTMCRQWLHGSVHLVASLRRSHCAVAGECAVMPLGWCRFWMVLVIENRSGPYLYQNNSTYKLGCSQLCYHGFNTAILRLSHFIKPIRVIFWMF